MRWCKRLSSARNGSKNARSAVGRIANAAIALTTLSADIMTMRVMTAVTDTEDHHLVAIDLVHLVRLNDPLDTEVAGTAIGEVTTLDPVVMIEIVIVIAGTMIREIPIQADMKTATADGTGTVIVTVNANVPAHLADLPALRAHPAIARNVRMKIVAVIIPDASTTTAVTLAGVQAQLHDLRLPSRILRYWRRNASASLQKCSPMPPTWSQIGASESQKHLRRSSNSKRRMIASVLTVADSCLMLISASKRTVLMNAFAAAAEGFREWMRIESGSKAL